MPSTRTPPYSAAMLAPPATLCAFGLLAALVPLCAPPPSGPVAALFPPWWSTARAVIAGAEAGPVIRIGGLGAVVVIAAGDDAARHRLRASGAWLLLDPQRIGGCLLPSLPAHPERERTP